MWNSAPARPVFERIEDAMREIGVLILALTPLDATFTPELDYRRRSVLLLLIAGTSFFVGALLMEQRRTRG